MSVCLSDIPPFESLGLGPSLVRDLRSDQAGEAGAVQIYRGILAVSRDPVVREFATHHLETEQRHLAFFDDWLPRRQRSRALGLWKLSGFVLGAFAALLGRHWVFVTIEAVETFVVEHYADQLAVMRGDARLRTLADQLEAFQRDEDSHRADAGGRTTRRAGVREKTWAFVIDAGSRAAVLLARSV